MINVYIAKCHDSMQRPQLSHIGCETHAFDVSVMPFTGNKMSDPLRTSSGEKKQVRSYLPIHAATSNMKCDTQYYTSCPVC